MSGQQFIDTVREHKPELTKELLDLFPKEEDLDFLIEEDHLNDNDFSWLLQTCPDLVSRLFLRSCDIGNTWMVDRLLTENLDRDTIDDGFSRACSLWLPDTVKILLNKVGFSDAVEGFSIAMKGRRFDTAEAIFDHYPNRSLYQLSVYIEPMIDLAPRSLLEKAIDIQMVNFYWSSFTKYHAKKIHERARNNNWGSLAEKTAQLYIKYLTEEYRNIRERRVPENTVEIPEVPTQTRTEIPLWKKNLETILKMEDSKADSNKTCVVCFENEPIIVFNCGHKKTCAKCSGTILQDNRKCPVCRESIVSASRLYE